MSAVSHSGFVAKAGEVWQGPHLRDLATSTYTLPPDQAGWDSHPAPLSPCQPVTMCT